MNNILAAKIFLSMSGVKVMQKLIEAQVKNDLIKLSMQEKSALLQLQIHCEKQLRQKVQEPCLSLQWGRRAKQRESIVQAKESPHQDILPFKQG